MQQMSDATISEKLVTQILKKSEWIWFLEPKLKACLQLSWRQSSTSQLHINLMCLLR